MTDCSICLKDDSQSLSESDVGLTCPANVQDARVLLVSRPYLVLNVPLRPPPQQF